MSVNIQVSLLGHNSLVREGLRHILSERGFEVVDSAEEPARIRSRCSSAPGNALIVLVDQCGSRYSEDDLALVRKQCGDVRLVFLTQELDIDYMIEAFGHGAHGFILNDVGCESLLGSLHLVALGEKFLPGRLVDALPHMSNGGPLMIKGGLRDSPLSDREAEILNCLVIGLPNKLIARRLDLCEATVKVHVKGILRKLGVQNRTQAAIFALNNGLDTTFRVSVEDRPLPGNDINVVAPQMA